MGNENVNPNRGLESKPLPGGGPLISMCKTVPGVYFDASGVEASDEMAAEAGFDVAGNKAKRAKAKAQEIAMAKVEAQFAEEAKKIDSMSDAEMEEEGIVEPGSLVDTKRGALEPKDGSPFITKTGDGEPRVARILPGGPVRIMTFKLNPKEPKKGWTITNRDTENVVRKGLTKEDATMLLLEEVEPAKASGGS